MKNLQIAAVAASLLSVAAPAAAMSNQGPIDVQSVTSVPASADDTLVPGVVQVVFQNTADVAAREVTFEITDLTGRTKDVEDVGTFAKGATIRHSFQVIRGGDSAQVRVVRVELADGSSWSAQPEAQPRRQAEANIQSFAIESGGN
jgi:hypothetical protein